jgi:hypothetical protein
VSILVEIAERADVSVEGVVRVLTREPVSDAIKERVLDVLDELTPEQTRAVQRFALAALHDDLQRAGDSGAVEVPAAPDPSQLALPVAAAEPDLLPATGSDAALVQLSSVLGELAEAVRDLRRETDAERRERVDDLAVLIDLITTGWQGLDARLGRIERQVSRLESGRREQIAPTPVRIVPAAVTTPAPAPAAAAPAEPVPPPEEPPEPAVPSERSTRDRLPVVAALSLVAAGAVTLAVLQLASGGPDLSRLVSARDNPSTATDGQSATASTPAQTTRAETRPAGTTSRPPAQSTTAPVTTSGVLGTTSSATTSSTTRPKPPAAPTTARTTAQPPAATTRPATTAAGAGGFKPTRNWAWAPVEGADYYDVVFTWSGTTFYRASPTQPRLTLPSSVVFRPGPYRWVVRPGFGARSAKNLGRPVVDSPFTVS